MWNVSMRLQPCAEWPATRRGCACNSRCALRALDLSCNRLPEPMALLLAEALEPNQSLTQLSLASMGLLGSAATALAAALRCNGAHTSGRTTPAAS